MVIQPFLEAPPGQKVGLVDVIDSRVGNLASGFMTFDHSKLPWFLNYDEVDYVIEGEFVLEVEGQVFRAKPGDVVYIPKGSQVVFSSPSFCKVFYCTYPANWADFCD
ncbi:MAG: cupin domain-containing protein [Desulfosporosinus sp.]|nr:cupin domain-containing protein [Desulfosporosinus sp.]